MDVLRVGRTAIWRTRAAYLEGGLTFALQDVARPGKPKRYRTDDEAQVAALACSAPPAGAERWTVALLTEAAWAHPPTHDISRETIRRFPKKTSLSFGRTATRLGTETRHALALARTSSDARVGLAAETSKPPSFAGLTLLQWGDRRAV